MTISKADRNLLELLSQRLERLSADSRWAHRASGVRGQLLRLLDQEETSVPVDNIKVQAVIETGFFILRQAAREIRWRNLLDQ